MSHVLSLPEEAGLALRCAADALTVVRRRRAWPWIALVVVGELMIVAMLSAYPEGVLGSAIRPLLRGLGGDAALNYPGAYAAFPRVVATIGPWLGLLLAWPGLLLLLQATPRILREADALRTRSRLAPIPSALLALFPGCLIAGMVPTVHDRVGGLLAGIPGMAATLAIDAAGLLLLGTLAHVAPAAIFGRGGWLASLGASVSMASRFPRLTLAGLLVESAVLGIFRLAPGAVEPLFERLPPEIIFPFLAIGAVAAGIVQALRVVTFGRLFLHVHGETPS